MKRRPEAHARRLAKQIEALGYSAEITPTAACRSQHTRLILGATPRAAIARPNQRGLHELSDQNNATGKARGKLHARTRALRKVDQDPRKARRIARNNLGRNKQASRRTKAQASVRTLSGQAVKEVVYGAGNRTRARGKAPQDPSQRPRRLGLEDLSHLTGKAKSKKLSRIFSTWMRSANQGRMVVHASIGGVDAKTVNAAYMSQTCPEPTCGYVSRDNRQGDGFHCRNPYWDCNWQGEADHVAATNLLSRLADREIGVYTHYTEVKAILDERFQRRKESRVGARIVPWGTAGNGVQDACVDNGATAHGRTPSKPRRASARRGRWRSHRLAES